MASSADRFWHNVSIAFSGVVLAQAIPIIGSLAIARIYLPQEFGIYASWLGIVTALSVALTGRFEMTLAIVADGRPRLAAACATFATCLVSSLAILALLLVAWAASPSLLAPYPPALLALLVPSAFFFACSKTWQAWAAANGELRSLSAMRVGQAALTTIAQIVVGWFVPTALALACAYSGAMLVTILLSAFLLRDPLRQTGGARGLLREIREFLVVRRRFPLLALPADSISAVATVLPLIMLANRFGAEVSGLLALTMRVLGAPISLLGTAVLDVFWRASGASFREYGHCRDDYRRTFKVLAAGSIAVTVVIIGFSEPLFVLAFGEPWRESGRFAAWLMPMFALGFVASPLSYVFYVANKQHVDLGWQCCVLTMTIATLGLTPDYSSAIQIYAIGYGLLYVVYLMLSWEFSKGTQH
ncbi:MAG TPA: oligosaccharide flippase family protein [Noviherbaspirillum sp.]|uniref:lipopolysaccharide biosynthesis protein n=1 Tax=Noviherbaspirillum sp. TaxID=1926288 RepID=UPI002F9359EC